MPNGKPAGVRCVQLGEDYRCGLFGKPERPAICGRLQPRRDMCGYDRDTALKTLAALELATDPLQ